MHAFGPDCDEYLRHLVFRDWRRTHPDDRDRYAAKKCEAAVKPPIIVEILKRAGLR